MATFDAVLDKLTAVGWIERVGVAREFKDVRLTEEGAAGLANVNALERALGGLSIKEAGCLFFLARKFAEDPQAN